MPERIAPMLPVAGTAPFDSREHIFELMWGGARCMAHVRDHRLRLVGQNGADLAPFLPELQHLPALLDAREAVLDGEIVVTNAEGYPAFEALRPRLHAMAGLPDVPPPDLAKPKRLGGQVSYQAFDLLWRDGRSLAQAPLWQRKNALHEIIRPMPECAAVDFVDDEGVAFFEAVVQRRLEGIVAKRKISAYASGQRSDAWQEIRALQSGDFVIGGYTFGGARRRGEPFSQLLLGGYVDGRFEYVGAVSGGLTDDEAKQLVGLLERHLREGSPFFDTPPLARLVYWTEPSVVCRVRFSEWSPDGYLRFPIFSALRPDVEAASCAID